jgi:hypothetical protein
MKHMKLAASFFLLLIITLVSCKGSKVTTGTSTADKKVSAKEIIKTHYSATPKFNTLAARVYVVSTEENKEQSITVSLRMERDKKIWIKASILGITLAKILITQDKVRYYETLSDTYFDGDFSLLSEWLGTEIDFDKAQSLLLGQSIFTLDPADYNSDVTQNKYRLQPNRQPFNFIHFVFLNPDNFKVASASLSQPEDNRLLTIRYGRYRELENGSLYPTELEINAKERERHTKYALTFKKIDLDVNISFPFTIPQGYEEIELSR